MKNKKKLWIGLTAAAVAVAGAVGVVIACLPGRPSEEDLPAEKIDCPIYWNIERDDYASAGADAESGIKRKAEAGGNYRVALFRNGETSYFTLPERRMVNTLDSAYLWGVVADDQGVVQQLIPLKDTVYQQYAWQFYVGEMDEKQAVTYSSADLAGMEAIVPLNQTVHIYDMTNAYGVRGAACKLQTSDRIMGVSDSEGNVLDVFVYQRSRYKESFCPHCQADVKWREWDSNNTLPVNTGHFYLGSDVALTAQQTIGAEKQICLDLNGKTVTAPEGKRIYSVGGMESNLALFDNSEEKTGKLLTEGNSTNQGRCVWVRYGRFDLYGGTLDGGAVSCGVNGTVVSVPKGAEFYMHGGTVIGGKAVPTVKADTGKVTAGMGGAVSVAGDFVMEGGTIRDGKAECYTKGKTLMQGYGGNVLVMGGSFTMKGGTVKGGKAQGGGGNVYVTTKGSFTMQGGTVEGGSVTGKSKNGGNIVIGSDCNFTLSGGTIRGGIGYNYAGNVHVLGNMVMSGGTISGGVIRDYETKQIKDDHPAKNLFLVNGTMKMSGGTVAGSMSVTDSKKDDGKKPSLTISGSAKIIGAPEGQSNLKLNTDNDGYTLNVGTMSSGGKIGVTASGKFSEKTSSANQPYFLSDGKGADVVMYEDCLFLGKLHCLCGTTEGKHIGKCDGKELGWSAWFSTTSLPGGDGYYCLTDDVACGQAGVRENAHTRLDLNGMTVTVKEGSRAYATFNPGSALTITDSSKDKSGKIIASGESSNQGKLIWVRYGTAEVYRGTLDASAAKSTLNGTGVRVEKGTTFTMYSGKIIGGTSMTDAKDGNGNAGAVQVNGTFNLVGGTVSGGMSQGSGGNISIAAGGVMNMYGGTVQNGKTLNKGANAGNILLNAGGTLNLSGGTIKDGKTQNMAGNLYAGGTLNMSGGTISGGLRYQAADDGTVKESTHYCGNVYLLNGKLNMSGGTIAGHIRAQSTKEPGAQMIVSGSPRIEGGTNNENLSFIASAPGTLPMVQVQGTLKDDARICLDASGFFTTETTAENADNFTVKSGLPITLVDNRLSVGLKKICLCGSTDGKHIGKCDGKAIYLKPWTKTDSLPVSAGEYYLVYDVTVSGTQTMAEATVVLDLNGKTVKCDSSGSTRLYRLSDAKSDLTITDSSTEKSGKMLRSGSVGGAQGSVIWAQNGKLSVYGGTLDASGVTGTFGAPVDVSGKLYFYGGTVVGGTGANGGAVRMAATASVMEMSGGEIIGGTAYNGGAIYNSGTITVTGGTVIGGSAVKKEGDTDTGNGGAIYNAGTLTVNGGTVTGGTAQTQGGTIYNKKTMTLTNGEILRGDAPATIALIKQQDSADAVFTIDGGTIDAGTPTGAQNGAIVCSAGTVNLNDGTVKAGAQHVIYLYNATMNAKGGTVTGGTIGINVNGSASGGSTLNLAGTQVGKTVYLTGSSTSTVNMTDGNVGTVNMVSAKGTVSISGGKVGTVTYTNGTLNLSGTPVIGEITVAEGKTLTVGEMKEGADVQISAADGLFAVTDKAENAAYFHSADGKTAVYVEGKGLALGKYSCSICGGVLENCSEAHASEEKVFWTAWSNTDKLPIESGYYYLTEDVTITAAQTIGTADVHLDLNGKTVKCEANNSTRIYRLSVAGSKLTITDTSEEKTGKLVRSGTVSGAQGTLLWVQNGSAVLTVWGGTLDASGVTGTFGAPLDVAGKFYFHGGTVIGGTGANGGAIRLSGSATVMEMDGGEIYGGKATTSGDNIYSKGTLTVKGGKIGGGVHNDSGSAAKLILSEETLIDSSYVQTVNAALPEGSEPYPVPAYNIKGLYTVEAPKQ